MKPTRSSREVGPIWIPKYVKNLILAHFPLAHPLCRMLIESNASATSHGLLDCADYCHRTIPVT
jgi:hypothetical protein